MWVAAGLAVLLVAATGWGVWTVRRSFPQTSGELIAVGLERPAEIVRDENGIPQIYADSAEDLFYTQGYVHAQDRFFEMDFRRHVVAGRLSELVGRDALDADVYVRSLGWYEVASQELAQLDAATRSYLEAYADGVNAYLDNRTSSELSLEYAVLGLTGPDYAPEPWTPTDSLAWLKALAWDLRSNMADEITRVLAATTVTASEVEELYPDYPVDEHQPILDSGAIVSGRFDPGAQPSSGAARPPPLSPATRRAVVPQLRSMARMNADLPELLGAGEGIGSNSWVVSGDHTDSGAPLLANDPHLAPAMPGVWEQMGLHCREVGRECPFDVAGTTFSGVPGVVIGHNDSIAWGMTTMYADVTDLYVERVDGDRYLFDGRWVEMSVREEEFEIAGEDEPETRTVRTTRHGPLLSDVDDDAEDAAGQAQVPHPPGEGDYALSLQWTALQPGRTMDALFGINQARSWRQFRAAARLLEVPSQNLVYADVDGHIGYQAPGAIPVRRLGDGRWPVPGWDARYGWSGTIPFRQLPWALDPPGGVIVTANQAVVDPEGYRYELGADTSYGYRSQRLLELLDTRDDWTVDDTLALQTDTLHPVAEQLVPLLMQQRLSSNYQRQGQQVLDGWDGMQPADSAAAAYFNVVWRDLLAIAFQDQLPEQAWPDGGERWFAVVQRLLAEPDSPWWDDVDTETVVEDRDRVLVEAMKQARNDLTSMQAEDPGKWSWGALHRLELENQTLGKSGIPVVETLFNRGEYELGGGGGSVYATAWEASEGFEVTAAPTMRMVVPLDDLDAARWVTLGGASGHAFSSHYNDQTGLWVEGETVAWPFGLTAVADAAEDVLQLIPPGWMRALTGSRTVRLGVTATCTGRSCGSWGSSSTSSSSWTSAATRASVRASARS